MSAFICWLVLGLAAGLTGNRVDRTSAGGSGRKIDARNRWAIVIGA